MHQHSIETIMSPVATWVSPTTQLKEAIKLMVDRGHSCVVVVQNKLPLGVITERDIVRLVHVGTKDFLSLPADAVMASPPVTVIRTWEIREALSLSRARKLRHLLVVDDQRHLIGIVTQTDMVRAYLEQIDGYRQEVEQQVKSRTQALENANRELLDLAMEDSLTRIGNRRAMEIDLSFTHASAQRYQENYYVALMDIDYFKRYNDLYGHQAGDETLVRVAENISHVLRESDRIYRYGGEEFLLLMPKVTSQQAEQITIRAKEAIEAAAIPHADSPFEHLTISAGIASGSCKHWEDSVKAADEALYRAKESGRNKVLTSGKQENC